MYVRLSYMYTAPVSNHYARKGSRWVTSTRPFPYKPHEVDDDVQNATILSSYHVNTRNNPGG